MSTSPTPVSVADLVREAVATAIPGADVRVEGGGGGHYTLDVVSPSFEGASMIAAHRRVYASIAHLMKGDAAPVHAIDTLRTRAR